MNIENIKETNFTKDVNNLPLTSDDNVLNKLDGFCDDTRLLGAELTLKALSEHKMNKLPYIVANGEAASIINNYVRLTDTLLSPDISDRWLILAQFDNAGSSDSLVTCKIEDSTGIMLGKPMRYRATSGGGITYAWIVDTTSNRRIYSYAYTDTNINLRCSIIFLPI